MAAQELIEEVATAIEQCGWEDVDVLQVNEVMAIAALRTVYSALIEHARQTNNETIIRWLAASPIGTTIIQN
ncbi:hypothetical protein ACWGNA_26190 [Brucella cytisi]|uniref:Uncharacterized protein n=1 Tax=Brucella cytisi TaxID=407152 RepID=A0A1J6HD25_9HYPH|nr:hypothetical protein [Brucella cytisi]OIS90283.1 hypothetical protein BLA27_27545 [Brucella cytisi]